MIEYKPPNSGKQLFFPWFPKQNFSLPPSFLQTPKDCTSLHLARELSPGIDTRCLFNRQYVLNVLSEVLYMFRLCCPKANLKDTESVYI